jgi:8-oxo-dGTP diphosphatase
MSSADFSGAKLAILSAGHVLAFLRDDRADIPFPGLWDLPGGGREAGETPVDTALRECWEEAGLRLRAEEVVWQQAFAGPSLPITWFLVAEPGWLCLPPPRLGDEGQEIRWMKVDDFLARQDAISHMQDRLSQYLARKAG